MSQPVYKSVCVVGNRPQFVKQAMFDQELARRGEAARLRNVTVNTGQHYDTLMSDVFFQELGAAVPGHELGVGSGPILDQIGKMLPLLREVFEAERPDVVITFGDTNSTLASVIAAAHSNIPCVHVEGGERLYRRRDVPEEINRVASDHLSDLILTSSQKATRFLRREGMGPDRVVYVGDIMLDLFAASMAQVDEVATLSPQDLDLQPGAFMLATLHRVENTSSREVLLGLLEALDGAPMPVLLPMHPRIANLIEGWAWEPKGSLRLIGPLGYFNLLAMLRDCALVVSDSGGLTREALFAHKGCIVPLDSCWWTEAVDAGMAITVGQDADALARALQTFRPDTALAATVVEREFGDARASARIVDEVVGMLDARAQEQQTEGPWHAMGYYSDIPPAAPRQQFSYRSFQAMVRDMREAGYRFAGFDEASTATGAVCLMRHDIDFDLDAAHAMAEVEAELDVASTYFFMTSTPHYNLLSGRARQTLSRIRELGHHVGLHFDPDAHGTLADESDYQAAIALEARVLEDASGGEVAAVSFHRPSELILAGDAALSHPFRHSYETAIRDRFEYVSDSNGQWKHGHPLERDAFAARQPMQILIHPVWWSELPATAYETLLRVLDARRARDELSFAQNCRAFRTGSVARLNTFER